MKVIVHPAAADELIEAASFYAARADKSLGVAMIAEFQRLSALLASNANLGATWQAGTRRLVMRRFPYYVIYKIFPDHVHVLAVAHQRRRPGYWRGRS